MQLDLQVDRRAILANKLQAVAQELGGKQRSCAAEATAVVLPDSTDLPFLEVTLAGHADALITGNVKHFKPRRGHHNVHVSTPT